MSENQVSFRCPHCGAQHKLPKDKVGRRARCSCGAAVVISASPQVHQNSSPPRRPEASSAPEAYLHTIGDIAVTATRVVTPNGTGPLRTSQWLVTDDSRTERRIPAYAIILAIVFAFFCLFGLFFLLIRETRYHGYALVTVRTGNLYHVAQIPVSDGDLVRRVHQKVSQIQALATQAPAPDAMQAQE